MITIMSGVVFFTIIYTIPITFFRVAESPPGRKPPEMLLLPQHFTKKKGETVTLECAGSGLPMPTLTWTFQSKKVF